MDETTVGERECAALVICALFLALSLFASFTANLYEQGVLVLPKDSGLTHAPGDWSFRTQWEFAILYMWHGLDALPALDAPKTLTIPDPPVKHDEWRLGLMLLIYKASVLVPLIAAFRGVWVTRNRPGSGLYTPRVGPR